MLALQDRGKFFCQTILINSGVQQRRPGPEKTITVKYEVSYPTLTKDLTNYEAYDRTSLIGGIYLRR